MEDRCFELNSQACLGELDDMHSRQSLQAKVAEQNTSRGRATFFARLPNAFRRTLSEFGEFMLVVS